MRGWVRMFDDHRREVVRLRTSDIWAPQALGALLVTAIREGNPEHEQGFEHSGWDINQFAALSVAIINGPILSGTFIYAPTSTPRHRETDHVYSVEKKVGKPPWIFVSKIKNGDHDMMWSGPSTKYEDFVPREQWIVGYTPDHAPDHNQGS